MVLPATGGTYGQILQPGINPLKIRKAIVTDVLIRDYLNPDGSVRSLADPAIGLNADGVFSPIAADGTLRSDLLTDLGFYHLGALHEDGTETKSDTSTDDTMIAQSIRAVRYDVKSDNDTVHIRAMESTPLTDALRFDRPLDSLADYGTAGYTIEKDAETQLIERQVIAIGFDSENIFAYTYPRMSLKDRGGANLNKADVDLVDITLGALLCPYVQSPVLLSRDGSAWRGLQGAPLFAGAPTATAVTGQKANVAFVKPTSGSSSYTYKVQVSNNGTVWSDGTISAVTGTSPNVQVTLTGITSSLTWYFRVVATGSNGMSTTSTPTTSIVGLT